jgi:hypothetical protein
MYMVYLQRIYIMMDLRVKGQEVVFLTRQNVVSKQHYDSIIGWLLLYSYPFECTNNIKYVECFDIYYMFQLHICHLMSTFKMTNSHFLHIPSIEVNPSYELFNMLLLLKKKK